MNMRISRRTLLKGIFTLFVSGLLLPKFHNILYSAEVKKKKSLPRPPGTCGGWCDNDGNGCCDRSERKEKPCNAIKCPGNVKNKLRAKAKEAGAPNGTCALWKDEDKKGFCDLSEKREGGCLYTVCPAHKEHKEGQAQKK
ncbi:MAG TPA: hypothetical protein P5270_02295 [Victivallales bacterium]|mgnify:FL=1|nr:hypothetical protein [Victivallales bacterium]HRR28169.1 hypothetical protein [Victivallales bacterium]